MNAPPTYAIEVARQAALKSPCAKSKRGVALFTCDPRYGRDGLATIGGEGFNGQPPGFSCSGTDACRRDCAKLCIHAEQRAILDALGGPSPWSSLPLDDLDLVHVKVVDGEVVPGGGPSCWQCSRLVVEVGLRGVWLYEEQPRERCGGGWGGSIGHRYVDDGREVLCPVCGGSGYLGKVVGRWRFYTAAEFHRATLRECGIGDGR